MVDLKYPLWMQGDGELQAIYRTAWEDTGNVSLALDEVRSSERYAQRFAGNVRDDGTLRYDENTYLSVRESYENTLLSINVNPDLFTDRFAQLIEGDVSPAEFATRVESMYTRVIDDAPAIAQYYADNFDVEMNDSAIMASLLDPDIGQAVINKRIAIAEVGGNAAQRGFDITKQFADMLVNAGLDNDTAAREFFGLAEGLLPTLQALTERHMDPDDDFSLEDFAAAQVFSDADQRRRIRNMTAAERSLFSRSGPGTGFDRGSTQGSFGGLVDR